MSGTPERKSQRERITEAFGVIFPIHLASSARLLHSARQHFHGDLDKMFIVCVILASEGDAAWRKIDLEKLDEIPRMGCTNTASIALSTGIPRATVQRKLADLVDCGWIERRTDTGWSMTLKAAQDLRGLSLETLRHLEAITTALRKSEVS
ncbi:helix-turn-helix domain-containing protein [Roseicyclus sp.]|uniref:helix-turn-helix domain-containing protein n=1 Tax=Roseicyclus sp. TaxID=1914329 RepID=UPI003F6A9981